MTKNELMIIKYIKENPYISQSELANKLNLSRSSVAGYISKLMKKGEILGRAYIVKDRQGIVCIGGANIDRKAKAFKDIEYETSNPVNFFKTPGGVARNIAENLGKLNFSPSLLTCVGDDENGRWLMKRTSISNVNTEQSWILPGSNTGTYTTILNPDGNMILSLDDMEIYKNINKKMIEIKWPIICSANTIFLDNNFPEKTLEYIIDKARGENKNIYLATISSSQIKNLPENIKGINLLFINKYEARELFNLDNNRLDYYKKGAQELINKGIKNVIIILSINEIILVKENNDSLHIRNMKLQPIDVTGCRDAFTAGVIYGIEKNKTIEQACQYGLTMSKITARTKHTVHPELSEKLLLNSLKEFKQ
ncbi:MAG: carbohydrate kinase [Halanaerobiaceae bacterium]